MIKENLSQDPSCSTDDGVTDFQLSILEILEERKVPQEICDQVIEILWKWENSLQGN